MQPTKEFIEKSITEIETHHRKIIDDWCKAYLSELYEESGSIKPGDFILCEQVPDLHPMKNILVTKYWFEKKEKNMSSTLTIEPSSREKIDLSVELKFALLKMFDGETLLKVKVSEDDKAYFRGLLHAGIQDAKIVIEMIEKYGECIINEDFL